MPTPIASFGHSANAALGGEINEKLLPEYESTSSLLSPPLPPLPPPPPSTAD
jgi:hypothetical protein